MNGGIKTTLLGMGFSDKEAQIYIYLGKRGPQKGGTIAKQLKINKGQVYRTLKILQKNGAVESTLEYPAKFVAVPLESVIDSFIKSKREEVDHIEETKKDLVSDWNKIRQIEVDSSLEKFSVIEGEKKVFHKISQMIKEAKKELLTIVSVNALLKANHYGLIDDVANHPLKNKIKFRLLTQLTKNDLNAIKMLLKKTDVDLDFKVKNPNRTSSISPRMVIKDKDEILLFISDKTDNSSKNKIEAVLCTNCQSIINSFYDVFQDLWTRGNPIQEKIDELESGKPSSIMELIKDPKITKKRYFESLKSSTEEVMIITSSKGLVRLSNKISIFEDLSNGGVKIKIMAPITTQNLDSLQRLLAISEVRHLPVDYFDLTLIDGGVLFQFNKTSKSNTENSNLFNMENALFTNDSGYIKRTKQSLFELWKKLHTPKDIMLPVCFTDPPILHSSFKIIDRYGKEEIQHLPLEITENEIISKISKLRKNNSKNISNTNWEKDFYFFGSRAFCIIDPPKILKLPKFIVGVFHNSNFSSFGEENGLRFFIKLKGKTRYQQVAIVTDNPESVGYKQKAFKGLPGQKNIIILNKNQLKIIVKENIIFVGWTTPIKMVRGKYVLPPGCILFETYGNVKSGIFKMIYPSNREQEVWYNNLGAFATYFHPKMNLVRSGTEAFVDRNVMHISHPYIMTNLTYSHKHLRG